MNTKCCKKCEKILTLDSFTKRKSSGYCNACKKCRAELNKIAHYAPKLNRLPCVTCSADRNLDRQRVHIRPLSSFDLTDKEQLKEACCYANLQPLWAKDNLSKGAKWLE